YFPGSACFQRAQGSRTPCTQDARCVRSQERLRRLMSTDFRRPLCGGPMNPPCEQPCLYQGAYPLRREPLKPPVPHGSLETRALGSRPQERHGEETRDRDKDARRRGSATRLSWQASVFFYREHVVTVTGSVDGVRLS